MPTITPGTDPSPPRTTTARTLIETSNVNIAGTLVDLAQLRHPNVCPILAMGDAGDGVVYVVMPFLAGETLADRIARGPVEPEETRAVARDLLSALGCVHEAGILHRDIKPANVLLGSDGRVPAGAASSSWKIIREAERLR